MKMHDAIVQEEMRQQMQDAQLLRTFQESQKEPGVQSTHVS